MHILIKQIHVCKKYHVEIEIKTDYNIINKKGGDAIYGITQDNRLVQLSYDGTVCNTLYTGIGTLRDIMYLENGFYLVDDNQIIEIDMETGQYRVLIEQDYLWGIDYWNEKEGTIYFLASKGLAYQQHKYDPVTAVLEKVSVMW